MPNRYASDGDVIEKAVKVALAQNSSSSIMFLLRERLIREVIETTMPILVKPYTDRISELEAELEKMVGTPTTPKESAVKNHLDKMKEATDDLKDLIGDHDPPII